MQPTHNKNKTYLSGVDRLQHGAGQDNTFIGALTAAMHALGEDVDYNYLMGVSGAAFRLHFYLPEGCPSGIDATCGFDCSKPALEALGYPVETIGSKDQEPEKVALVRENVVKSIDAGKPVLAIDLIQVADWGIITGYIDNGKDFLCRTYYDKGEDYNVAEKWPWDTVFFEKKKEAPSRGESIAKSIKIAIELAETPEFGKYASGFAAFEALADLISDDKRFATFDESSIMLVNSVTLLNLMDARKAAVKYLCSIANEVSTEAGTHLWNASNIYQRELSKLELVKESCLFPWQMTEDQKWTQEMRQTEAEVLKDCAALEWIAVDELRSALEMLKKV